MGDQYRSAARVKIDARIEAAAREHHGFKMDFWWDWECWRDGELIWVDRNHNLTTNVGRKHVLDNVLDNAAQITPWYVGLIDGAAPTPAVGDTMASHAGWTENQDYTETLRQTITWGAGTTADPSVIDNSAAVDQFSINGSATINGGFITSDNAKGGTAGTLFGANTFTGGSRAIQSGDTVNVTITVSCASA